MKRILLVVVVVLGTVAGMVGQEAHLAWAYGIGGPDWDEAMHVYLDDDGNVSVVGSFSGSVDFDPSSSGDSTLSREYSTIFIAKYTPTGQFVSVRTYDGFANFTRVKLVDIDPLGNIHIVALESEYDYTYYTWWGNVPYPSDVYKHYYQYLKLTENGSNSWSKLLFTKSATYLTNQFTILETDSAGSAYIAGKQLGTYPNSYDIDICKIHNDSLLWSINDPGIERVNGMCYDNGLIYAGNFVDNADFDPGQGVVNLSTLHGDDFVSKIDGQGNFQWAKNFGQGICGVSDLTTDHDGNVLLSGTFNSEVDFDPDTSQVYNLTSGPYLSDAYILKLDAYGDFVWVDQFTGNDGVWSIDLDVSPSNTIYSKLIFRDTVDLDPGTGVYPVPVIGPGNWDNYAFVELNSNGDFIQASNITTTPEYLPDNLVYDFQGNVYCVGNYDEQVDLDPDTGTFYLPEHGLVDVFLYKLAANDTLQSVFYADNTNPFPGEQINFNDISIGTPTSRLWDFGDGVTDTAQNPVHAYPSHGTYTVTLLVSDGISFDTLVMEDYIVVQPTVPDFEVSETTVLLGDSIHFTDMTTGFPMSWQWDFGDGNLSNLNNTSHIYQDTGTYTVSLVVYDGYYTDTIVKEHLIKVLDNSGYPEFQDVSTFGGIGMDIKVDNFGNIYTVGYFEDTVDFDPGPGTYQLIANGRYDFYISKVSPNDSLLWVHSFGSSSTSYTDYANALELDDLGNVVFVGNFSDTVDFDPGPGTHYLYPNGYNDVFVCKLSSQGNFLWAISFGGSYSDYGNDVAIDEQGNIYITGEFYGYVDFDPSPANNMLLAFGTNFYADGSTYWGESRDAYVVKFDPNGTFVWVTRPSVQYANVNPWDNFPNVGKGITIDNNGDLVVTGMIRELHYNYNNLPSPYNYFNTYWTNKLMLSKIDRQGQLIWEQSNTSGLKIEALGIETDYWNNIIVTGKLQESATFDSTNINSTISAVDNIDGYIAKFSSNGEFDWAKQIGGLENNWGASASTDLQGNIYITERYEETVDFDFGVGELNRTSNGESDVFITKLDGAGELVWVQSFGGISDDYGQSLTLDEHGNVYTLGQISGTVDFDPGLGSVTSSGGDRTFIHKISQDMGTDFVANNTEIYLGDTIDFLDASIGEIVSWHWDFGDGTTDTVQNPIHIYQTPGTYTVTLIASDSSQTDTVTKTDYIQVDHLEALFSVSDDYITLSETIEFSFQNTGYPTAWHWDFGDGTTDSVSNPIHTYQDEGLFTVSLIVTDGIFSDTVIMQDYISVIPIMNEFFASETQIVLGDTIWFTNQCTGFPSSFNWDFGDGTSSIAQHPYHVYQGTGTFNVASEVSYSSYTYPVTKTNYIVVNPMEAAFTASDTIVNIGDTVQFTDLTEGNVDNWFWDFGDGTMDTVQHPVHVYQDTGTYTVLLVVTNSQEIDSLTIQDYIHVDTTLDSQTIIINQGWNIISTYIDPTVNDINIVFSSIVDDVIIVKDEFGQVFWPLFGLDVIDSLTIGKGYQIKMDIQQSLTVMGILIAPETTPLNVLQGWNLLGYLRTTQADLPTMLSPLGSTIIIVKNGQGHVYWPAFGFNQIGNMLPGQGYQIKMSSAQVFTYPANSVSAKSNSPVQPSSARPIKNTGANMTLGLPTQDFLIGEEIIIKTQAGLVVGSGLVSGGFTAITLWGDDEQTRETDGLQAGEEFIIQLASTQEQIVVDSWQQGDGFYETNKIAIAGKTTRNTKPETFNLFQNNPNPFSDHTEFTFYLPAESSVAFEIYNLLGKRVAALDSNGELEIGNGNTRAVETLHATSLPQGTHTLPFNRNNLPAGTYFYRLKTIDENGNKNEQTKKMVMVRE